MKMRSLITALFALSTPLGFAQDVVWTEDFAAAKEQAEKEGKDLLINFTGTDWCLYCKKLDQEVFQQDVFKKGVADKFVLVKLDYPKDNSKMDQATIEQNEGLLEKYQNEIFPTILLTDASGKPFANTSYLQISAPEYMKHLEELYAKKAELKAGFDAADQLEGVAKAKAIATTLRKLEPRYLSFYKEELEMIEELDKEDESGLQGEIAYRKAKVEFANQLGVAMNAQKPDKALSIIDSFIENHKPKDTEEQEILAIKINIHMSRENIDEAEAIIDRIIEINPKSEFGISATNFKPRFLEMKKQAAAREEQNAKKAR